MQTLQHKKTETELHLQFGLVVFSSLIFWIPREHWLLLIINVGVLSYFYSLLWNNKLQISTGSYVFIFISAVFAPTNLSQDVYRFLWDGKLILNGINPHDFRPREIINQGSFSGKNWRELYRGMGTLSQRNYSCYPFVTQIYSSIAALVPSFSIQVIVLKLLFVGTFLASWSAFKQVLAFFKFNQNTFHLFWLNPLVLVEGLGNLHFEWVMLCFVILSLHFLLKHKFIPTALFLCLAIQAKLVPLLILPFFVRTLGWGKSIFLGLTVVLFVFFSSLIFINSANAGNFLESIALYYGRFEFNSPIYAFYLEYGMWRYYFYPLENYAAYLTQYALLFLIATCFYRLKDKSWETFCHRLAWALTIYYVFATTVHPWYLIFPLFFAVLSSNRLTLFWSFLIFLSYVLYDESLKEYAWLIRSLEYGTLVLCSFSFIRSEIKSFWRSYLHS